MHDLENKPYFKIGEVCEITGTQPYVLRFWESEFPTLAPEKNRSGQRVYRKRDIELIRRIKTLLYEKEYTIAGARKVLEGEEDQPLETSVESESSNGSFAARESRTESGGRAARHGGAPKTGDEHEDPSPPLPFKVSAGLSETALEAEVKNLRAKLARAEAELKSILEDMNRRDEDH